MVQADWRTATQIAGDVEAGRPVRVGLHSAIGHVLAQPVAALADLPAFPCADQSGFAVRGFGPWTVRGNGSPQEGDAALITAGAAIPEGCDAVLPNTEALIEQGARFTHVSVGDPRTGQPARRAGELPMGYGVRQPQASAAKGDLLIKSGVRVSAGTAALAAAGGADDLTVIPPPTIAPVLRNGGLLSDGPPRRGKDRAVLATLAPAWAMMSGARSLPEVTAPEKPAALADAIDAAGGDIVLVTPSSSAETLDTAMAALKRLGATILISEIVCQPGGRTLYAELTDGRRVLCLPLDPSAAMIALATILTPALHALAGSPHLSRPAKAMLRRGVTGNAADRAIPVIVEKGELADLADPQPWSGPADLGPFSVADGIAFIEQGRGEAHESVSIVPIPGADTR